MVARWFTAFHASLSLSKASRMCSARARSISSSVRVLGKGRRDGGGQERGELGTALGALLDGEVRGVGMVIGEFFVGALAGAIAGFDTSLR